LAARLDDTGSFTNFTQPSLLLYRPAGGGGVPFLAAAEPITMNEFFTNKLEIYSAELQQIFEQPRHNTILGARIQYGHFDTGVLQNNPSVNVFTFFPPPPTPSSQQDITSLFKRISFYGYHQWQIFDPLQLIGGVTYDRITFPENFRTAPVSGQETTRQQISPKAGLIWMLAEDTAVRFA
jgi:outer membrane receptor protein involved in Fe transport